ncbi:DNA polymerase [Paenibacillus sp. D2_2]|uniref:DNA polymerase n=1 Tax=Paenibacillus sp. D2_2 TaxID=3073092 RepID=UPI0035C1A66F
MEKLILIDGNSIIYRAFFAMPPLTSSSGVHTNAVYGFTNMLVRLLQEEQPSHILVAFDAGKETFRHEGYQEYKGGREKTPPELSEQFPIMRELLESFGISWFELSGYEADDIIGTISKQAEEAGHNVLVVTGDKDMLQLVSDRVKVALTRKGITEVEPYGTQEIEEKYGLRPEQIIDLKGLMGDASDNIPGVPGIGEKTALKLLHQFGSVEEVLARTDELKGKMKENLVSHAEDARMSKRLATIFREVPVERSWDDMAFSGVLEEPAAQMLRKLEFKSLLERLSFAHGNDEDAGSEGQNLKEVQVTIINDETIPQLVEALPKVQNMIVESYGENPHHAILMGVILSTEDHHFYLDPETLQDEYMMPVIKWLGDTSIPKQGYDLHKADLTLYWQGVAFGGAEYDIQLAAYLLDPTNNDQTVSGLAAKYGIGAVATDEEVYGKGAKFKVPDQTQLSQHLARKSEALLQIMPLQKQELEQVEMNRLFYDLEMPLSRILADMEKQGVAVNRNTLIDLGAEFEAQISTLIAKIYERAGLEFNLNSPKQLGEVLFDKLQLPVIKKTKTGYSTDAEVLEKLALITISCSIFWNIVSLPSFSPLILKDCLRKFTRERVRCIPIIGRRSLQLVD